MFLLTGKILFTGRQKCSLYLVLWLCGLDSHRKAVYNCCRLSCTSKLTPIQVFNNIFGVYTVLFHKHIHVISSQDANSIRNMTPFMQCLEFRKKINNQLSLCVPWRGVSISLLYMLLRYFRGFMHLINDLNKYKVIGSVQENISLAYILKLLTMAEAKWRHV